MTAKFSTFHFTVLTLVALIMYAIRFDLILLASFGYAVVNKPAGQQLLGEYYQEKARFNRHKAFLYHRAALNRMVADYPKATASEKGPMAHLIASNFECGKGTAINLQAAKKWYHRSKAAGFEEAGSALNRLEKLRKK